MFDDCSSLFKNQEIVREVSSRTREWNFDDESTHIYLNSAGVFVSDVNNQGAISVGKIPGFLVRWGDYQSKETQQTLFEQSFRLLHSAMSKYSFLFDIDVLGPIFDYLKIDCRLVIDKVKQEIFNKQNIIVID